MPFRCPRGDNGICGDPTPGMIALFVWDGDVSLLSGKLLEQFLHRADREEAVPADERETQAIAHALRLLALPAEPVPAPDLTLEDLVPHGRFAYVECKPCGDIVKVPVP